MPEPADTGADSPVLPGPAAAGSDGPMSAGPTEMTSELPVVPLAAESAVGNPVLPGPVDAGVDSPVLPGPADTGADSPVPPGPNEMTIELPVVPRPGETIIDYRVPPLPAETAVGNTGPPAPADAGLDRAAPSADTGPGPGRGPGRGRPVLLGPAETAHSRSRTALAVAAGLVVAVAGLAQTSPGHSLLREVGLSAEPATYTALAFTNPQSLPSHLPAAPAQVAVSFAVSNVSPDPHSYSWSIVLEAAGQTSRVAAGEVGVPAHGHATVTRTVTASCPGGQAVMAVRLAAPAESIDFQAACSP